MIHRERGSGSLLAVAILGALVVLGSSTLAIMGVVQQATRAQLVANLAALAASDTSMGVVSGEPCSVARAVVTSAGFRVSQCEVLAGISRVVVVSNEGILPVEKRASARPQRLPGWEEHAG